MIVNFYFCYTKFDRFLPKLAFWNAAFINPKTVDLKATIFEVKVHRNNTFYIPMYLFFLEKISSAN